MPESIATTTKSRAISPITFLLALSFIALLALNTIGVITIPWWVVFAPIIAWMCLVATSGLLFLLIVAFLSLGLALSKRD